MTPEQVVDLLSLIAARDRRTIGRVDVAVWGEDIGDLDFADARRAVADHFRDEPGTWLMAGHVRARVKAMRETRIGPTGPGLHPAPPPADPDDPAAYLAALREQQSAIGDGHQPRDAVLAGNADPDDNPHARRVLAEYKAARDAKAQRDAAARKAESDALRMYRNAVETLLAQDDHGRTALDAARDELLGDAQAAQDFPLLRSLPGVMDEHKIHIWAARNLGGEP